MPVVWVPALLRSLCGGAAHIDVSGATLADVLRETDLRCPGFFDRVVEDGRVRPELAIAINGEVVSLPLHEPIPQGAEIAIVPAIGGG